MWTKAKFVVIDSDACDQSHGLALLVFQLQRLPFGTARDGRYTSSSRVRIYWRRNQLLLRIVVTCASKRSDALRIRLTRNIESVCCSMRQKAKMMSNLSISTWPDCRQEVELSLFYRKKRRLIHLAFKRRDFMEQVRKFHLGVRMQLQRENECLQIGLGTMSISVHA
jgi:hypothetical protein